MTGQYGRVQGRPLVRELPAEVRNVIATALQPGTYTDKRFFRHPRLGLIYRAFLISQLLEPVVGRPAPLSDPSPEAAARVLSRFGLTGDGSEDWLQIYEHVGTVVAAAQTIANRMKLNADKLNMVRSAALLHDATKRRDVERHGIYASSSANTDHSLVTIMRSEGYCETTIAAAMNTGREDREFASSGERRRNIADKGIVAAIVALADARTIGAEFRSLADALADYLSRKTDPESTAFFTNVWMPYYQDVEAYLTEHAPALKLDFSTEDIYYQTVLPEVLGLDPPAARLVGHRVAGG